jgi:hypothetical protein
LTHPWNLYIYVTVSGKYMKKQFNAQDLSFLPQCGQYPSAANPRKRSRLRQNGHLTVTIPKTIPPKATAAPRIKSGESGSAPQITPAAPAKTRPPVMIKNITILHTLGFFISNLQINTYNICLNKYTAFIGSSHQL